ncbi:MAG: CinA family protein [Micromonosporaceae bacterium]
MSHPGDLGASSGDAADSDRLAAHVVAALRERGQSLAVAESLTGGALSAAIVAVPGASQVFRGGLVVYAADLKVSLAEVDARLLEARGPVDRDVAAALADGARARCRASWGLATTGVAGPDSHGGQPPGTVWLGMAGPAGVSAWRLTLPGDRAEVRAGAVLAALRGLVDALE